MSINKYLKELNNLGKENVEDLLRYAYLIKKAVTPSDETFSLFFSEHLLIDKPKFLVGGDFYWVKIFKNKIYLVLADCTGHNIKGALLSLLGMKVLDNIFEKELKGTDEYLYEFKSIMDKILLSTKEYNFEDGIDITICCYDHETKFLQFSSSYGFIFHITEGNYEFFKGDRIPIGYYASATDDKFFNKYEISLKNNDIIYLCTDGIIDQFGGPERKKFTAKRFGHLLIDISNYNMQKQKEILEKTLEDWQGNNVQVDDITVIGLKV